jgi:hypothetical protein
VLTREGIAMMRVSNAKLKRIISTEEMAGMPLMNGCVWLAEDLRDARALLAKLNGVQFAPDEERLAVVAEVSAYLAGGGHE